MTKANLQQNRVKFVWIQQLFYLHTEDGGQICINSSRRPFQEDSFLRLFFSFDLSNNVQEWTKTRHELTMTWNQSMFSRNNWVQLPMGEPGTTKLLTNKCVFDVHVYSPLTQTHVLIAIIDKVGVILENAFPKTLSRFWGILWHDLVTLMLG